MIPEQRTDSIRDIVPALWWNGETYYWDVMNTSTGNLVGQYDTWAAVLVDFPEWAVAS